MLSTVTRCGSPSDFVAGPSSQRLTVATSASDRRGPPQGMAPKGHASDAEVIRANNVLSAWLVPRKLPFASVSKEPLSRSLLAGFSRSERSKEFGLVECLA